MRTLRTFLAAVLLFGATLVQAAPPADPVFDAELLAIQQAWARANYEAPAGDAREAAFDALQKRAGAFARQHPGRAEPKIWAGIVASSYAGAKGGLGALSLAKEARADLEAALKIDPTALDGSAYTSLGTLYYKVPGFPLGFGDDDKARELLGQALKLNPDGIDPNYFFGEFLCDEDDPRGGLQHLDKALKAAPRPGREVADEGRRGEIRALITRCRAELD